jgi:hypothetical protein
MGGLEMVSRSQPKHVQVMGSSPARATQNNHTLGGHTVGVVFHGKAHRAQDKLLMMEYSSPLCAPTLFPLQNRRRGTIPGQGLPFFPGQRFHLSGSPVILDISGSNPTAAGLSLRCSWGVWIIVVRLAVQIPRYLRLE